jgi:4,5-DOPA dioxygenase extradiol
MDNPIIKSLLEAASPTGKMPVLFVGHGNPMNAIEDNPFTRAWKEIGEILTKPRAIVCISAHWETWGSAVTAMKLPRTIHDFGGFPQELYAAQYPASGNPKLAERLSQQIKMAQIGLDEDWGLDHGCWSVLKQMFPKADIPVVQLSLDYTQPASYHYSLGKELAFLRNEGVLILGSGNMVHNLRRMAMTSEDFNQPFGFDWALNACQLLKKLIVEERHEELIHYQALSEEMMLAVPTPEHYLPLLYCLAVKQSGDSLAFFNDQALAGSISMTSLVISGA